MSDSKPPLTTSEVEMDCVRAEARDEWCSCDGGRLLATTRALEIAQTVEADLESHVSRAYASLEAIGARLETAERARDQLANVAGATMGLRYVDFAGGEEVVVSDAIREHALWSSMRETIRERDEARTELAELVDASERLLEHYSAGLPDHLVEEFRTALAKETKP